MGTREETTPSKPSKPPSSSLEVPSIPYPNWSSSMQAYYGAGGTPPPVFPQTVASPGAQPYMWGAQFPLIPSYSTPVPYPAMYPPGGVYTHQTVAMMSSPAKGNADAEGKGTDAKDHASAKNSNSGKVASGSGNDVASQSAESGSEGSSAGSDEPANHQELFSNKNGTFGEMLADANGQRHVGMNLWNSSDAAAGSLNIRPNPSGVPLAMAGREQWMDERELKRQKRKQSNRESARRSRLRKQAECDELKERVQKLTSENQGLKEELQKLSEECQKLASENDSIKEELTRICGPEALAYL